ncbi:hypothetical protein HD806DRAFT_470547 [Xylariaceae sp. AK1471]|nr:hypothetical protein HD806DRAFT_470547 [Xylariaceae sp. AK1471]
MALHNNKGPPRHQIKQPTTPPQEPPINEVSYHYAQVYCGFCGRFITDIGGFASAPFAAQMESGKRPTPGVDLLASQPDLFTREVRDHVVLEKEPRGLARALKLVVPLRLDPVFPRLYLQPHLCYHDLEAEELYRITQHTTTTRKNTGKTAAESYVRNSAKS